VSLSSISKEVRVHARVGSKATWGLVSLTLIASAAGLPALAARAVPQPAACAVIVATAGARDYIKTPSSITWRRPIGVTKPKLVLAPGGLMRSAAWKQLTPRRQKGYWESYKAEIAVYELDKLLEMHMVPPTVQRRIEQELGAFQLWVEPVSGWHIDKPAQGPEPEWSRRVIRMKLFDQLTANIDRNEGNLLYDADWHLILIDHSRAFTDQKELKGMTQPGHIDKWLWDRIDALTLPQLKGALGPWLREKEIEAILARRDRMRAAIAKMVAERGEDKVFLR
jgi:hypothetical protein